MASDVKGAVGRLGRRAIPRVRRAAASNGPRSERIQLTVGDLVVAAFDALGDARSVARVLSSPEMACALRAKIVFE